MQTTAGRLQGFRRVQIARALGACVALAAIAFAACGGDDESSPTSTSSGSTSSNSGTTKAGDPTKAAQASGATDGCKLLTKEDAAAALGGVTDLLDGNPTNTSGNDVTLAQCVYVSPSAGTASVLARKSSAKDAGSAYDQTKSSAAGAVDVPGVGEKAFYSPQYGQLNILVKDTWIILSIGRIGNRPATASAELIALGKKVAARI